MPDRNPPRPHRRRRALLAAAAAAALAAAPAASAQDDVLKIFLLLGQSNMEGQAYTYTSAQTDTWNIPTLEFLLSGSPAADAYLAGMTLEFKGDLDPSWSTARDDVWAVHYDSANGNVKDVLPTADPGGLYSGVGPLSPGFGVNTNFGSMFGPELALGIRLGDLTDSPIFLFKSDRGGTTLGNDWRPPSAVAKRGGSVGSNYTNSLVRFREFLDELDADLGDDGRLNAYGDATSYQVCAVFWFQGWNEQFDDAPYSAAQMQAEYADNLQDLIYSIRAADDRIPGNLGLLVGESSDQNAALNAGRIAAVDALNSEIPNSAAYFDSAGTKDVNWGDNDGGVPFSTNWGYHFHARAESFLEIGWRAAGAVLDTGFLGDGAPLYFGFPRTVEAGFDSAELAVAINADADGVVVVWDTEDRGNASVGDWPNSSDLGAWTGGAAELGATLGGLMEDTTYVFRFFAESSALAASAWSGLGTFTTPFENPPPLLGEPDHTTPTTSGTEASCALLRADADATGLVWAHQDQGETDAATWAGAAGGGSVALGAAAADTDLNHALTGLDASAQYVLRFFATNAFGTVWSEPLTFRTARDPDDWAMTAYYDFEPDGDPYDDPAGTFADDLVGRHNPALSDDVSPLARGSTQSAIFDGDSALFTDAYTTDLGPDPNAYTIMFWVKGRDIDQENNNTRLMTTRFGPDGSGTGSNSWQIEGFGNNGANGDKMDLRMHGSEFGSNNWFQPDATNALAREDQGETEADWHHVAFVVSNSGHSGDGGVFGLTYVDGSRVGGEYGGPNADWDGSALGNHLGQLIIGGHAENAGGRAFTGQLDDIALFAGIVPAAEIAAIAGGEKSPAGYLAEPTSFAITSIRMLPDQQIELTWNSKPDAHYTIFWSGDLADGFEGDVGDDFESGGDSTTVVFDNPTTHAGNPEGDPTVFFRIGEN